MEYIVAIDIGTSKIMTLIARVAGGDDIQVLGAGLARNRGSHKGNIISHDAVLSSLRGALEQAEVMSGLEVVSAVVNIANAGVRVLSTCGTLQIAQTPTPVTEEHLLRALNGINRISLPKHRSILHIVPSHYDLDGRVFLQKPIGEPCIQLEISASIMTVDQKSVEDIEHVLQRTRCLLEHVVVTPVALRKLVSEEEIGKRTLVVDLGAGCTSWAVFEHGQQIHTRILAVGGEHVSNDIAIALGLPFEEADRMKIRYGAMWHGPLSRKEMMQEIEYRRVNGSVRATRRQELVRVIDCRMGEMLDLIAETLAKAGCFPGIHRIVLSGGGAMLPGLTRCFSEKLHAPCSIGCPDTGLMQGEINNPHFSTAWCMLHWGLQERTREKIERRMKKSSGFWNKTFHWIVESI